MEFEHLEFEVEKMTGMATHRRLPGPSARLTPTQRSMSTLMAEP